MISLKQRCSTCLKVFDAHGHQNVKIVSPDAFMNPLRGDVDDLYASPNHAPEVDIFGVHGALPLTELYGRPLVQVELSRS